MSDLKLKKLQPSETKGLSAIDAIQRPDLVTLITDSIRQRVLDGSYAAGHVLPAEADLAKAFSVSRNVMREALRQLRVLGLVEVSQGRPPRIRGISPEASINALGTLLARCEVKHEELMDTRAPLEVQVVTLLAEARQPDIASAAQANIEMSETNDFRARNEADRRFHVSLAKATGNQLLATILETVVGLSFDLRNKALSLVDLPDWPYTAPYPEQNKADHDAILDGIRRQDVQAARDAMLHHMKGAVAGFQRLEEAAQKRPVAPTT